VNLNVSNLRKKRKASIGFKKKVFRFVSNQLGQLRDIKASLSNVSCRESERGREESFP
jgi:hypothetical protein